MSTLRCQLTGAFLEHPSTRLGFWLVLFATLSLVPRTEPACSMYLVTIDGIEWVSKGMKTWARLGSSASIQMKV